MKPKSEQDSSLVILVGGISGAGKSKALATLSDLGFYTIDNLPAGIYPNFLELADRQRKKFHRTAILLNIDLEENLDQLISVLKLAPSKVKQVVTLFIDADTEIIKRRYSETRRPHPLFDPSKDSSIEDAISRERTLLGGFRGIADRIIDTSGFTVHDLKRELTFIVEGLSGVKSAGIRVNFLSFGFKNGLPSECDLVTDLRFLPNPYFVDELRDKTGLDKAVRQHVLNSKEAKEFIRRFWSLLSFLIPHYIFEGKSYLTVGIGCTGGRHRSVAIAEALGKKAKARKEITVSVIHRDIQR